jgi:hypothetical protein
MACPAENWFSPPPSSGHRASLSGAADIVGGDHAGWLQSGTNRGTGRPTRKRTMGGFNSPPPLPPLLRRTPRSLMTRLRFRHHPSPVQRRSPVRASPIHNPTQLLRCSMLEVSYGVCRARKLKLMSVLLGVGQARHARGFLHRCSMAPISCSLAMTLFIRTADLLHRLLPLRRQPDL